MKNNNQQQTSESNALAACYQLLLENRAKREAAIEQAENQEKGKGKGGSNNGS